MYNMSVSQTLLATIGLVIAICPLVYLKYESTPIVEPANTLVDLALADLVEVEVRAADQAVQIENSAGEQGLRKASWRFGSSTENSGLPVLSKSLNELVSPLNQLLVVRTLAIDQNEPSLAEHGLAPPGLFVRLLDTGGHATVLEFGNVNPVTDLWAVRRNSSDSVFLTKDSSSRAELSRVVQEILDESAVLDRRLFTATADRVQSLEYLFGNGNKLMLLQDSGGWTVDGAPGDQRFVKTLLRNVLAAEWNHVLKDEVGELVFRLEVIEQSRDLALLNKHSIQVNKRKSSKDREHFAVHLGALDRWVELSPAVLKRILPRREALLAADHEGRVR